MTNWKTFKILIATEDGVLRFGCQLDGNIDYCHSSSSNKFQDSLLVFRNRPPFNTWKKGDYIEIDLDRIYYQSANDPIDDTSMVRKVGSSNEVVSRNNNIPSISRNEARGIVQNINEAIDSDERNEYEAKIHVDPNSGKYSGFSIIGRRK